MALRQADEQTARMAEDRGRLESASWPNSARQPAYRRPRSPRGWGLPQSAVARLESGIADVRASTLERYAAAVGGQITWKLNRPGEGASA